MKETERILDKEVQDILHTPNVHRPDSYEEYDFETLAAQAIQNQMEELSTEMELEWREKRKKTEKNWNQKREEIERQCRETMEEQAIVQASIITQETEDIKRELQQVKQQLKQEIATASKDLQDIRAQNENQIQKMTQFQSTVTEVEKLKQELREEVDTLIQLKTETREETTQINKTLQEARRMHQTIREQIDSTIQQSIDSQMAKVEKGIHHTLQKRGKILVDQAKRDMAEQLENQTQEMDEKLERRTEETFNEATSLLDQAVMGIGEEMKSAVEDFNDILSNPQERTRLVERLQTRAMNEIRPQIRELQEDMTKEVSTDIERAIRLAQEDLVLSQVQLTKDTEEKIQRYNEMARLNGEALRADLRKEAENLESTLHERHQEHLDRHQEHSDRPPPAAPEPTPPPATPEKEPSRNPYLRPQPVSPYPAVDTPPEDIWNQMVSKCKEKVTLTYSLPQDAKDLDQTQAEAFYRQIESNFKGYPAVRLQKFDTLHRRGSSIPVEYAMGWPPAYVEEASTILYEKLMETIPHSMTKVRNILTSYQTERNGYKALIAIMKRSIPRLMQLPPKMEPTWPKGVTPTEYANKLRTYTKQQENFGRYFCDFEVIATMAQRGMEHPEYYNVASNRATQLVSMASRYDKFQDVPTLNEDDSPYNFATILENYHQGTQQHQINMMETGQFDPSINKFERGGNQHGRNNNRTPREGARDGKPKEICPCCLRHGHNVEKGSVCWMGAQVENVLKWNKENPIQAKQNTENFKKALNPVTIAKMIAHFPKKFEGFAPDSTEMLEAAVEVFELFVKNDE